MKRSALDLLCACCASILRYTNASEFGWGGKKVLVVGSGNSGSEIALDCVEHGALPTILARSPQVVVPRRAIQIIQQLIYTHVQPMVRFVYAILLFHFLHNLPSFFLRCCMVPRRVLTYKRCKTKLEPGEVEIT